MADIYLSPSGNDANLGTIGSPKFTLEAGFSAANAGDTIYMRGGTYQYLGEQDIIGKNGSAGNLIKLFNYPGEVPVVTRSASYIPAIGVETDLIYMESCSYIHIKGIEIANYSQSATLDYWFAFRGNDLSNCIFENINYHHNGSAFTLRGDGTTGNLFLNCDFHHNQDPFSDTPYDGADGLNITYVNNTAAVNTVRNCRAWWNADDGFDFWENEGYLEIDNCWSFYNGHIPDTFTTAGNGSGFKLGRADTSTTTVRRYVHNCLAFKNRSWGFVENDNPCNMTIVNNTAVQNGGAGGSGGGLNFWFGAWGAQPKTFRNNISYDSGTLFGDVWHSFGADYVHSNNSWDSAVTVSYADFQSTDDSQLDNARASDGTLPIITFLKLTSGSDLIDAGTNVGLSFTGAAPDMGYAEYSVGGNISPIASAGADQLIMLPNSSVTLSGSGSDSDGTIVSYAWSQISGTSATIISPSSQNTTITGLTSAGTYVFRLTVTDNLGATGTDDITITVNQNVGIMSKHLIRMGIISSSGTVIGGPPPSGLVDIDFTSLTNLQESPANKWIPVNNALDANGKGTVSLPALTDGQFQCEIQSAQLTDQWALGWDPSNTLTESYHATAKYLVFPIFGTYWTNDNLAGAVDSSIAHANGDLLRLVRTGSVIKAQYYRGGIWNDITTFTGTDTGTLYFYAASAQNGTALALLNPKQEGGV